MAITANRFVFDQFNVIASMNVTTGACIAWWLMTYGTDVARFGFLGKVPGEVVMLERLGCIDTYMDEKSLERQAVINKKGLEALNANHTSS